MSRPGPKPGHPTQTPTPAPSAAALRTIVMTLTLVVLGGVAGVAYWRGAAGRWAGEQDLLLPGIVVLLAMFEVSAFFVLRITLLRTARANFVPEDRQSAWAPYATLTMIGAAMAAGVSVFGAIVFCVTTHWLALIPAAVCLPVLLALYPTDGRFDRFVNTLTGGETR